MLTSKRLQRRAWCATATSISPVLPDRGRPRDLDDGPSGRPALTHAAAAPTPEENDDDEYFPHGRRLYRQLD